MPRAATVLRDGTPNYDQPAERRPGEFARHAKTGAPFVADPVRTTKRDGKKADLIAECAKAGIAIPEGKVTVAQLHELLGGRPCKVQYGRPSSLGKQIENTTNLQKWSERAVALGCYLDAVELFKELEHLDPSTVTIDDLSDDEARDLLDAIAVKAKNRARAGIAAERGTHGHELTEDHDNEVDWIERARRGEALGLPFEAQDALVRAWELMLAMHGFEILAVEAKCVDDIWRQAGTLDRIVRLTRDIRFVMPTGEIVVVPKGTVLILDIKTGKLRLDYAGFVSFWLAYSVQLASYAQSKPYDPDTDTRGEWPWEIDQRWAIIAHLDILAALDGEAKCRLVLVDLEAGRAAGALCVTAREWEKRTDVFSIPTDDLCVTVPVESSSAGDGSMEAGRAGYPSTPAEEQLAAPVPVEQQAAGEVRAPAAMTAIVCGRGGCQTITLPTPSKVAVPVPPTVEQPTPEVPPTSGVKDAGPGAVPGADRRQALLRRYQSLNDNDKRRYLELHVDKTDLDAVETALNKIDPFMQEPPRQPAPAPSLPPEPRLRFTGDEGPDVSPLDVKNMRMQFDTLNDDERAPLAAIVVGARDTVGGFLLSQRPSRRRWEIYRGLITCARFGWSDELVRAILVAVTGDLGVCQPAVPLGVAVGMLDVAEAEAFADLAVRLERGAVVPVIAEGDDHFSFVEHSLADA